MKRKLGIWCAALVLALCLCAGTVGALAATATPQADAPAFATELSVREKGASVITNQEYESGYTVEIAFTADGQSLPSRGGYGVVVFDIGVAGSHFVRITMEERAMSAWLFPIEGLAGTGAALPITGGSVDFADPAAGGIGWVLNALPTKFKFVTKADYSAIDIYFALANAEYAATPNRTIALDSLGDNVDINELKLTDGAIRILPDLHDSFVIHYMKVNGTSLDFNSDDVTLSGGFARQYKLADFSVDESTENAVRAVSPVAVSTTGFNGEDEVFSLSFDIQRGNDNLTASVMNTTADFGVLFGMPTVNAVYTDNGVGSLLNGADYTGQTDYAKGLVMMSVGKGNGTVAEKGEDIGKNQYWRGNDTFFGKARVQLSAKANGTVDITFIVGYPHESATTLTQTVTDFGINGYIALVCEKDGIDDTDSINFSNINLVINENVAPTGVTLDKSAVTVKEGGKATLTATVEPNFVTDGTVDWESSNEDVATVSATGEVTGVAFGTAVITAKSHKDPTLSATCTVTVLKAATGVTLNKSETRIARAQKETLTATVAPAGQCDATVIWTSSNEEVATVENGVVSALKKGTATITATTKDGGFTATCEVTVYQPVNNIVLDSETLTLEIGDEHTLTVTVTPSDADDKTITWTSSNESVATVDRDGKVVAVGAGKASVTVTTADGELDATCAVTVVPEIVETTGIALDKSEHTIAAGESFTLTATVSPADATDKTVTWASSDESVATVDANGKVTAVKEGTVTITATSGGGAHSASCAVTVTAKKASPKKKGCGSVAGAASAGTAAALMAVLTAVVAVRKRTQKA